MGKSLEEKWAEVARIRKETEETKKRLDEGTEKICEFFKSDRPIEEFADLMKTL